MELTEPQWKIVEPLFPPPKATGRPRRDDRLVLEGVLWVLRTGARWKDLPGRFPPYQTCHRRFQQWVRSGLLDRVLQALYEDLVERGQVKLDEWFIDGSFVLAKGGALLSITVPEARGARSWQSRTAMVYLSLSTSPLLHRMKLPWSIALSTLPSASITPLG